MSTLRKPLMARRGGLTLARAEETKPFMPTWINGRLIPRARG